MSESDLAWAAGFFDGEGCVDINATNGVCGSIRALLANTSLAGVERMQALFGGSIRTYRRTTGNHVYYTWSVSATRAAAFYTAVLMYAVVKREQIEIALAYQSRRKGRGLRRDVVDHSRDVADMQAIRRLRAAA